MKIFIIGQCSLHWGRMEYGNIGNYYIIEPLIRELHRVFPGCSIKTTMQLSDNFCRKEMVHIVPLDLYYGWTGNDLENALHELEIAVEYNKTGKIIKTTSYIKEILSSDLVIDFSGDIWGDNADFLGANRLRVGLIKDRVAQLMNKKTVMLAGSPGPFSNPELKKLAQEVYSHFDIVTNREPVSTDLLKNNGFDISKTYDFACPSFLFEHENFCNGDEFLKEEGLFDINKQKPVVGFIICGWNFESGPFDKWPRQDSEYTIFAETIEYVTNNLGVKVCLMSHSNGFDPPPSSFRLKHGRDYPIIKQLEKVLIDRGLSEDFFSLNGIYDPWHTKSVIGKFDMLISGRIHGAVAALSQNVPTVIIDYGHQPKAHKLRGFAAIVGAQEYVANPSDFHDLKSKVEKCLKARSQYKRHLEERIPIIKNTARKNFDLLKDLF